ncbi:MAG: sterol desaturase family protein [Rhodospirillales bacterium]|nr:sterol desaturase family protein [Alphaproteobacteria bacterium]MBL6947162.1 sterol desaturase family protein [Rhodospirillales bacterium]
MTEIIQNNEIAIRLGAFFGIFALMAVWELAAPRRGLQQSKAVRWYSNLGIVAVNTVIARIVFPLAPVGVALWAAERGWGVLGLLNLPGWALIVLSVVILDFAIYLQHVMVHAVPMLWRLHRMHHADLDFDVTTGARFHPVEIVLSVAIKMGVIVLIGAPAVAVVIFEVLLNATAMFNHSNVRLPLWLDRVLRLFVVTPDMHRVHHSVLPHETNSNFGFNLPWWDRLFGTYRAQPEQGHEDMDIGIDLFRTPGELHLHKMLAQPFTGALGEYAINRRDWKKEL